MPGLDGNVRVMDESNVRYQGWRVAAAGTLGVFLASLVIYPFGILLKPLAEEFAWSREAVSSAYGVAAMMAALSAGPLGYLLDRARPKRIIVTSVTVLGCGFVSLSMLTAHPWHFYLVFAVLGVAGLGTSALAYSRLVSGWFDRRRGLALGVVIAGGALAGMVHPAVTQVLVGRYDWRGTCLIFGGVILAVGVPAAVMAIRERPSARSKAGVNGDGASVRDGLRSPCFWIPVIVIFCASIAQNAVIVHLPALLTDRGVPAHLSALAMSAMGAASLAGRLLTGWLVDRYFGPRVSFGLLLLLALGTFMLADAQSFAVGAMAAVLIGFGIGGESDVTPYLLSRYFGLRSLSTLYGFTWVATGVAGAVGPVLMGRAFDATGSYEALLVRISVATLAVAALMLLMPPYDSVRPSVAPTAHV